MKKLLGLTLFTLLFSACKLEEKSTQSSSAIPNFTAGSCTIGKWSDLSSPINLKMSSDFSADYTNSDLVGGLNPLEQMAKVWNNAVSPGVTLFTLPFAITPNTGYNSLSSFRDNDLGIYKSTTWFNNVSSSALAITQFYGIVRSSPTLGTYIDLTHADIIVNYRDFGHDLTMTGNPLFTYDLPTIVLHEMGHLLGLCHESNRPSIMAPYYYTSQRTLKAFDTTKIQNLYLNNINYNAFTAKANTNALTTPEGTAVKGIIELNADGKCRHYVEGKLIYEHDAGKATSLTAMPRWYKNLPWK